MITLKQVVNLLREEGLFCELIVHNDWHYQVPDEIAQQSFQHVDYDSRKVGQNTLYICKGLHFKEEYLHSAIKDGAKAYLSEKNYQTNIPGIIVNDIQKAMAVVARAFYRYPDKDITTIGITGTKGKTTSTYMLRYILTEATNHKVAQTSSSKIILDGFTEIESNLTTPESLDLFRYLREAVDNGMEYFVMEVSSQAYKLKRVYGITFDIGTFLNISPDHISDIEHPHFSEYINCNLELLNHSKQVVLNQESDYLNFIEEYLQFHKIPYTLYGARKTADYYYTDIEGLTFEIHNDADHYEQEFNITMPGRFNVSNAAGAITIAKLLKIADEDIRRGLQKTVVAGRMEKAESSTGKIVYVDFAHNYLSMKECLQFLRLTYPDAKLFAITGSIGGKAKNRRVGLGKAMSEIADIAIITSEDSMDEDPQAIMQEIASGLDPKMDYMMIEDRDEAIKTAITQAKPGDVVLIAGKGYEQFFKCKGETIPYIGDLATAKKYLD